MFGNFSREIALRSLHSFLIQGPCCLITEEGLKAFSDCLLVCLLHKSDTLVKKLDVVITLNAVKTALIVAAAAPVKVEVLLSSGATSQHRFEDVNTEEAGSGNYVFGYDEKNSTEDSFLNESRLHEVKVGSYALSTTDGRQRIVSYVADAVEYPAAALYNATAVAVNAPF
ncbi:hypothetical protein BIW11_02908 [Tropilaelaps mercedesae]|uniref:Uncharacterized protein n=1 Tax=Tropilaelaps mercedesae TaxID=418985 RepID=A0A1V9XVI6_9ACAR|nr:hypothetical protein BIW11_02908 [Tropilaelaps mercedesae]